MKLELLEQEKTNAKEDLIDIQKGLNDMFRGYVQSLDDIHEKERDIVVFSYTQLTKILNNSIDEVDK